MQGTDTLKDRNEETAMLREAAVARLLGYSPCTLRDWRHKGVGPRFVKVGAGRQGGVRYFRDDIEEFVRSRTVLPDGGPGAIAPADA